MTIPRYTTDAVWGDWYGLHAACAARGWSLSYCAPPHGAPCYYEVSRAGGPALRFATRDAVCDWVDKGNDMLTIHQGDNLEYLRAAVERGDRFDLVELDGPYGAGLEDWDSLTEAEYVQHYAERLTLVRQVLRPWGVVFLFGYPEMVALVRAWAAESGALHLRRWITWYKQVTAHKGRKVETVAVFMQDRARPDILREFGAMLRCEREARGWSLRELGRHADKEWWHRGGTFYYETGAQAPSAPDYAILKRLFAFGPEWDVVIDTAYVSGNYSDLTDLDYIARTYPERTRGLNDAGLRSKPMGLYADLFRPVVPPRETKRALILYGGSGNAAFAAARLGYDVTLCETDPARCARIKRDWAWEVERRDETPVEEMGPLFSLLREDAA